MQDRQGEKRGWQGKTASLYRREKSVTSEYKFSYAVLFSKEVRSKESQALYT